MRSAPFHLAIVVALVLASTLPGPHAILMPDSIRDMSASLELARGEGFPLAGPSINSGPHLGPAWIWLQAAILLAVPTFAAAGTCVAAIAALKFLFLYELGRLLSGPRLGLCFAIAAAIPSIAVFQWLVSFHPNWVETWIVASLALLVRAVRARSLRLLYVGSAVLGLAMQHHPTAVFYFPAVAFALVKLNLGGRRAVLHLTGLLLMLAMWFLPLLFATDLEQGEPLSEGIPRIEAAIRAFGFVDVLAVLRTAYVEVPLSIGDTYAAFAGMPGWAWRGLLAVSATACVAGLAVETVSNRDGRRSLFAALAVALLSGWIVASAVRSYTSYYLCYFLLPLSCVLAGFGFERALSSGKSGMRILGSMAMAATFACFLFAAVGARGVGASARMESSLPLLADLKHPGSGKVAARLVGGAARDSFARFACAEANGVTLHGDIAYTLAASTGLDFRLHCPEVVIDGFRILGPANGRPAWTVLSAGEAKAIGRAPARAFGGLAAFPVKTSAYPAEGRSIETGWYYFEQLRDRQPLAAVSLSLLTAAGDSVMIYRLKPFDSRWRNVRVERDGKVIEPALSTHNSAVYLSGDAASGCAWRIDFETDAPQWVDVHAF
jgi:hypothetical protein